MNTIYITDQANGLDEALKANRAPGTKFILGPGKYRTRGAWGFKKLDYCMIPPGCSLHGDPGGLTEVILSDPVTSIDGQTPGYFEILTGGNRSGVSPSVDVARIRIGVADDFGYEGCPIVGLHLWTTKATVERINVSNVRGSRTYTGPIKEGFGILINNSGKVGLCDGGHQVLNCAVMSEPQARSRENYTTGIYVGCEKREGSAMLLSTVQNCNVIGQSSHPIHCAYGINSYTAFYNANAYWCDRVFFSDTGCGEYITINKSHGHDCLTVLELMSSGPTCFRQQMSFEDCYFHFRKVNDDQWVQAVLLRDGPDNAPPMGGTLWGFFFVDCRFAATQGQKNCSKGRARGAIQSVRFSNTSWMGRWQPAVYQDGAEPWMDNVNSNFQPSVV